MGKEIKRIGIVFENCDVFYVDKEHITLLRMFDITENIYLTGHELTRYKTAAELYLKIEKDGNGCTEFDKDFDRDDQDAFQRVVKFNDVTEIEIGYTDGSVEFIYVDYKEASDDLGAPNLNQTSLISETGDLIVVVTAST